VPKAVTDALKGKAPKFTTHVVHSVTRHHDVVGYVFATKKHRIAFVSSDGKDIEIHKDE
jgi:hypothetical protein